MACCQKKHCSIAFFPNGKIYGTRVNQCCMVMMREEEYKQDEVGFEREKAIEGQLKIGRKNRWQLLYGSDEKPLRRNIKPKWVGLMAGSRLIWPGPNQYDFVF